MKTDPILGHLQNKGFRITGARQAVIDVLQSENGWLTPEKILAQATASCPSLGLATVYRTLELLSEEGFIRRIHFEDGCHGYARADLDHGHHLICRSCHEVIEFEGLENIDAFIRTIETKTGYTIQDHMLELVGICPQCH